MVKSIVCPRVQLIRSLANRRHVHSWPYFTASLCRCVLIIYWTVFLVAWLYIPCWPHLESVAYSYSILNWFFISNKKSKGHQLYNTGCSISAFVQTFLFKLVQTNGFEYVYKYLQSRDVFSATLTALFQ